MYAAEQRKELKRKADGISRSLSEVFAYLTYRTALLEKVKKLLTIITNASYNLDLAVKVALYNTYLYIQLDFKPAEVVSMPFFSPKTTIFSPEYRIFLQITGFFSTLY